MKLQYMYGGGALGESWIDAFDREDEFVQRAADYNGISVVEARRLLSIGRNLQHRSEWDAQIRSLSALENTVPMVDDTEMTDCKCGHTVSSLLVMTTSRGTSCSECYDRMSL